MNPRNDVPRAASLKDSTIEELVEIALDATVRTGAPAAGRRLVEELGHRGDDALWNAALLLLGLLAIRPVYGLREHQGVEQLRRVARTADPVTALVLGVQAVHRADGAAAAREAWNQDSAGIRSAALSQLLITTAFVIGSGEEQLGPQQTVRLIKEVVIAPRSQR
ncbi:hypothetical protein AB0C76_33125 [Kitasatospora sp. NPDC048722]|uniref:hypothetical protein n=1 Tax=Kitasatospora sp. NPDC048722 TaxID=3155639 RepID=UPI0033E8D5B9